jgi:hypothetical protein
MLRLLKKNRQDVNGVTLLGEIVVKGSTMVLCLITGMACLQGAENEETKVLSAAVGSLDQPGGQPGTSTSNAAIPSADGSHIDHHAAGRQTDGDVVCPDCAKAKLFRDRPLYPQTSCGNPECTTCHHARFPTACPTGRCANHGLIGGGASLLHGYRHGFGGYGEFSGYGVGGGGCLSGGCSAGTRVVGSPVVERATGVPFMRVSEWPSTRTGLTLTEEQHLLIGTGAPAACQLIPKPAYINIPDHVW